jgi:hypothetical protein
MTEITPDDQYAFLYASQELDVVADALRAEGQADLAARFIKLQADVGLDQGGSKALEGPLGEQTQLIVDLADPISRERIENFLRTVHAVVRDNACKATIGSLMEELKMTLSDPSVYGNLPLQNPPKPSI